MSVELNEIIWQVVNSIPKGKVATYGQIAAIAGYPKHARLVGNILKKLPKGTSLPWHRIINAQGKISFPIDSEAYKRQRSLLEQEGLVFFNGKLSLKQHGWQG